MHIRKKILVCYLVICLAIALAGCNRGKNKENGDSQTVKIGVILDFSGEMAEESGQMLNAVKMAVDEINSAGGVLTQKLQMEIIVKDDKGNYMESVAAYYQLVQEGACAVIGTNNAEGMKELIGASAGANVAIITPSVTNDFVVDAANFCYQSCFSDKYMTEALACYVKTQLGCDKIAVMYDASDEKNILLYEDFVPSALAHGLEIVYAAQVDFNDADAVKKAFERVCGARADAVFAPAEAELFFNNILKGAGGSGYEGVFLGLPEYGGAGTASVINGCDIYVPCSMAPDSTKKETTAFLEKFLAYLGSAEAAEYAQDTEYLQDAETSRQIADGVRPAYDAVYILRDAIEAGYVATPVSIALKLPFLEGGTALGDYEVGAYGDIKKSVDFIRINDSGSEYAGTVFE